MERPMTITRHYVLAAGGTGGHMIPAHAVAVELMERGPHVALVTDDRGAKIPGLFDQAQVHILPAGRMAGDRKSTRLNSSHSCASRLPASACQKTISDTYCYDDILSDPP